MIGRSTSGVLATIDLGKETVKTHVAHVLSKLGVENRAQATLQAIKRGLISID